MKEMLQALQTSSRQAIDAAADMEALEALRFDGTWDTPHLFFDDNSVADW